MTARRTAHERRWIALILLCAAQFVVVLDAAIVNVALPTIGDALKFTESNLPWVVNAYVLTFGGFLLLGGRMADLLGRRRVFMAGLVLFALASLAGGLATSEGTLIAARAVQGLGGALLSPAALSIVTTTFREGSERNKALGVWGAVAGAGGAAGVLLGGVLTDTLGWQWGFFVNTPVTLAAAALAAALLVAFVVWEQRSPSPLMPFRIFRLRNLSAANAVGLLVGASLFSMFFFISLYMQQVLHYSPLKAGFSYLPLAVTIIVSAGVASQLVTRLGFKPVLIAGMGLVAAGL